MVNIKSKVKAFLLIEVLAALSLFSVTFPAIISSFLRNSRVIQVDKSATALIADIDNCITNTRAIPERMKNKVQCLLCTPSMGLPDGKFYNVKKEINSGGTIVLGKSGKGNLELHEFTISNHPSGGTEFLTYSVPDGIPSSY